MEEMSTRQILPILIRAREVGRPVKVTIESRMGAHRSLVLPASTSRFEVARIMRLNVRDLIKGDDEACEIGIGITHPLG